jgi:hypothetical protein
MGTELLLDEDILQKLGRNTCRPGSQGPQAVQCEVPTTPTWTGSSTLLLRKLRELARFILKKKDG